MLISERNFINRNREFPSGSEAVHKGLKEKPTVCQSFRQVMAERVQWRATLNDELILEQAQILQTIGSNTDLIDQTLSQVIIENATVRHAQQIDDQLFLQLTIVRYTFFLH